jgi:hypothetical protein
MMVLLSVALFGIAIGIPTGIHAIMPHRAAALGGLGAISVIAVGCCLVFVAHPLGGTPWIASDLISLGAGLTLGGVVVGIRHR